MNDKEKLEMIIKNLEYLCTSPLFQRTENKAYLDGLREVVLIAKSDFVGLGLKKVDGVYCDDKMYDQFIDQMGEDKAVKRELQDQRKRP